MSQTDRTPATPRLAATLLLVRDDPFEVLMVQRHAAADFASALVFPGGVVDAEDGDPAWLDHLIGAAGLEAGERALRIAAYRETYEETGLLLVSGAAGDACGEAAGGARAPFLDVVRASGGRLALDALEPFGHWITPEAAPKRYDTHFYLCGAPALQEAVCDGTETVSLEWVRPSRALDDAADGTRSIIFPTRMNLRRLAESDSRASALAAAKARPVVTVLPVMERTPQGPRVTIPEAAGYGVTAELVESDPHRPALRPAP